MGSSMKILYISIILTLSIFVQDNQGMQNIGKRTKYSCEGSNMQIVCESGTKIELVRANFGRFNNAICNDAALTNFSLNCYQPKTLRVVKQRCENQEKCEFPVNTQLFGEPCPGTSKYIEVHYSCTPKSSHQDLSSDAKPLAPWLLDLSATPPTLPTTPKLPTTPSPIIENVEEEQIDDSFVSFDIDEEVVFNSPDVIINDESEEYENEDVVDFPEEPVGHCPPINERGIFWNWTISGTESIRSCPPGSSGFAKWRCQDDGHWSAEFPNLSNCQSNWIRRLDLQTNTIESLLSTLDKFTSSQPLYGGDIPFVVRLLQILPERLSQEMAMMHSQEEMENAASELQEKVSKIASDLLEEIQILAWQDLEPERKAKLVSGIYLGVTESNLVMADVLNREKKIRISSSNVISDIRVKGARQVEDQFMDDQDAYLLIKSSTLSKASVNGAVRVGFFTFKNMEYILSGIEQRFINSEIVGIAIPNMGDKTLTTPVLFTLRHKLSQEAHNPLCVAWNYRSNAWSSDDCFVKETSNTHTTCECYKLSQYAIAMEPISGSGGSGSSAEPHQSSKFDSFEKWDVILIISFLLASSILLLSVTLIIAKRRKFENMFSCNKANLQSTDSSHYYPSIPVSTGSHYAKNCQQQNNGPNIIYHQSELPQNSIPYKNELYGHIYSEISTPASSASTYMSYLNETSSDVSSEENMNRGSPTFLPLLRADAGDLLRLSSSRPQLQQQHQTLNLHHQAETSAAIYQQQQQQQQPLAITLQDGHQFVRLKLEDPYTIEPIVARTIRSSNTYRF